MIVDFILGLIAGAFNGLLDTLPDWSFTPGAEIGWLATHVRKWNHVAPVNELLLCMGATLAILGVLVALKWGVKVIDWIRG